MSKSVVKDKSFDFAVRIVNLNKFLHKQHGEYVMSKQLLRCGTSIGANVAEAQRGQSMADFAAKMNIALKEAHETEYWLKLLVMSEYITEDMGNSLLNDCLEIKRILVASINTAKENK